MASLFRIVALCTILAPIHAATPSLRAAANLSDEPEILRQNRQLYVVGEFSDPQDVEEKVEETVEAAVQEVEKEVDTTQPNANETYLFPFPVGKDGTLDRPLNILTMGGSITWGATLDDRTKAFPSLLGNPFHQHVDNMAMRATGADYPSLCLESMIPRQDESRASYDLILLDFVQNGTDGFPLLLKRLRQRYPDAVIVYVKLWSLLTFARDPESGRDVHYVGRDPTKTWAWKEGDAFDKGYKGGDHDCGREICNSKQMEDLIKKEGGFIYEMPLPETPNVAIDEGWFDANDWHHLSEVGHKILAEDLSKFLSTKAVELFKGEKKVGSWGKGDQCYNWFMSGENPLSYTGFEMKNILKGHSADEKWVLAMTGKNATITVESKFDIDVPLGLGYMSRQDPATYPLVEVTINDQEPIIVDPNVNREKVIKTVHITAFNHIGSAKAGTNVIKLRTLDSRPEPFRVVGVYLCGECAEFGNLGAGAINFKPEEQ